MYNVTGDRRKALVRAIGEVVGCEPVYQGAPSFAFAIGNYIVDRAGTLSWPEDTHNEESVRLVAALKERGYEAEVPEEALIEECHGLIIEVPREGFTDEALENLRKIIASKKVLIEKALGVDSLPFVDGLPFDVGEDKLCFPWFVLHGIDGEVDAYNRLVHALCNMAKKQKRVTAKEQETENDKFSMRLFLVRLGFVGPEYAVARRILLRNLTGNSSWKNGKPERTETTVSIANTEAAHDEKP